MGYRPAFPVHRMTTVIASGRAKTIDPSGFPCTFCTYKSLDVQAGLPCTPRGRIDYSPATDQDRYWPSCTSHG